KVAVHRPRVRSYDGHEVALPTWRAAQAEDWLGRWAMNLMLINVSTRKLRRAVRLPAGDLPVIAGDGTSKSAASRAARHPPRLALALRRSLACPNSIENMMGTVRRVCRNVNRWRNAAMALRWTAAGMMEAANRELQKSTAEGRKCGQLFSVGGQCTFR